MLSFPLFLVAVLNADQKAYTITGEPIILSSDGTWTYELGKKPDFRTACWGDRQKVVLEREEDDSSRENEPFLSYKVTIAGMDMEAVYAFEGNALKGGFYQLKENYIDHEKYIAAYQRLREILIDEYGEPHSEAANWKNDLFKDKPEHWGLALFIEHVDFSVHWNYENTNILISLGNKEDEISLAIFYLIQK